MNETTTKSHANTIKKTSKGAKVLAILSALLLVFGAFLWSSSIWLVNNFGRISVEQALDNLSNPGDSTVPASFYWVFLRDVGLPTIAALIASVFLFSLFKRFNRKGKTLLSRGAFGAVAVLAVLSVVVGAAQINDALGVSRWIAGPSTDTDIADYYVEPKVTGIPDGKTNLIIVFLESMDRGFGDANLVEGNALKAIQDETKDWVDLDSLTQYPSGGWTQSGMVATFCGIPLRAAGEDAVKYSKDIAAAEDQYLPGATCITDLLSDAGYKQVFMAGANKNHSNTKKFMFSHGIDEIRDLPEWEGNGETEIGSWGLSDRRLFELAKEELLELHNEDQPFMLSFTTVDNHAPTTLFPYCDPEYADDTLSSMKCQSDLVADFIRYAKVNGVLEDTAIAIVADHKMLESYPVTKYREKLNIDPESSPLFARFYAPNMPVLSKESRTQLDLAPTLFEMVGGKIDQGRLGVGVSLLAGDANTPATGTLVPLSWEEKREVLTSASTEWIEQMWREKASGQESG